VSHWPGSHRALFSDKESSGVYLKPVALSPAVHGAPVLACSPFPNHQKCSNTGSGVRGGENGPTGNDTQGWVPHWLVDYLGYVKG